MAPAPLIRLHSVDKSFGAVAALRSVNLDLYAGEAHALVGENGAGKSTLVKLLAGVHTPDAGSITVDGAPVRFTGPADARHGQGVRAVEPGSSASGGQAGADRGAVGPDPQLHSGGFMRRVCFTLQVNPARLAEYRERHAAVWPEMLHALRDAGWHDYSLFLRDDGLLVGYLLTDDLAAAQAAMEATDVNRRWQADMAPFFVELPGGRPDLGFTVLDEVFNLDAQLGDNRD